MKDYSGIEDVGKYLDSILQYVENCDCTDSCSTSKKILYDSVDKVHNIVLELRDWGNERHIALCDIKDTLGLLV